MASDDQPLLLQMSADISQLQKQLSRAGQLVTTTTDGMQTSLDKLRFSNAPSLSAALDKVFDTSRLQIFDQATDKIGLAGGALTKLGAVGLAAAAGVAALATVFEQAKGAAEFAGNIAETAKEAHVSTDALQEYRYAVVQAGGSANGADQALEAFSATLGKAQEGLTKSQRAFLALGFSKDQIMGFKDTDDALQQVIQRIGELKSTDQQDAVILQFGLDGLKPLILEGADAMDDLKQKALEAGVVMDAGLVQRGAEANRQFETLSQVVNVQLKSAFVDLAPVLLDLMKFAAGFAQTIAQAADSMRAIEAKTNQGLLDERGKLLDQIDHLVNDPLSGPAGKTLLLADRDKLQAVDAQLAARSTPPPAETPHGNRVLIPQTPKTRAAPTDESDQMVDQLQKQEAAARRALVDNLLKWVEAYSPQDLADIDALIIKQEEAEKTAADAAQAEALAKVETALEHKKITPEAAKQAQAAIQQTHADQTALATTKADQEILNAKLKAEQVSLDQSNALLTAQAGIAQSMADLATTARKRADFEMQALLDRQQVERENLAKERSDAIARAQPSQVPGLNSYYDQQQGLQQQQQELDRQSLALKNQEPIAAYQRSLLDLNTQFQNFAVEGIKSLSDALVTIFTDTKNFGSNMENVFRQIFAEILSAEIQKDLFSPILGALGLGPVAAVTSVFPGSSTLDGITGATGYVPHFASGTSSAPGGLSLVGEDGPELLNIPGGSQVIPNDLTRGILSPSQMGDGARTTVNMTVVANDAVMASQIYDTIDKSMQKSMAYARGAVAVGYRTTIQQQARTAANSLRRG